MMRIRNFAQGQSRSAFTNESNYLPFYGESPTLVMPGSTFSTGHVPVCFCGSARTNLLGHNLSGILRTRNSMTENSNRQGPVIGVDIGGTKVAVGWVDATGKILSQLRKPMIANGKPEAALEAVTAAIDSLAAQSESGSAAPQGIGICAPGPLNPVTGMVINPPNLPCWRNFPLASRVTDVYRVPVKLDND